jgi:hypothetical protein
MLIERFGDKKANKSCRCFIFFQGELRHGFDTSFIIGIITQYGQKKKK